MNGSTLVVGVLGVALAWLIVEAERLVAAWRVWRSAGLWVELGAIEDQEDVQ